MKTNGKWIQYMDKVLLSLLTICVSILFLSQLLLLKEGTRLYLSKVDKMEGEDLAATMPLYADLPLPIAEEITVGKSYQNLLRSSKVIVIKRMKNTPNSNAFIMVNGKRMDDFTKGDSKLTVYDGDYVEIDGTSLQEKTTFLIRVPEKGLLSPQDGLVVEGARGIFPIGKIKFKSE